MTKWSALTDAFASLETQHVLHERRASALLRFFSLGTGGEEKEEKRREREREREREKTNSCVQRGRKGKER